MFGSKGKIHAMLGEASNEVKACLNCANGVGNWQDKSDSEKVKYMKPKLFKAAKLLHQVTEVENKIKKIVDEVGRDL